MLDKILPIFGSAAAAMFQCVLLCAAGVVLVRFRIIRHEFLKPLSRITISLFLPCLLITKIGESLTVEQLKLWWILPASAVVYAVVGFAAGMASRPIFCRGPGLDRFYVAASALGNSGYLPMMLIVTICQVTPQLRAIPESGDIGLACVSVYLFGFVPCLWGWAFPYVSGHGLELKTLGRIFNPPMISVISGSVIGLTPLKHLFWGDGACLAIVSDSAGMIGACTIPCAMIILGGNLSRGPDRGTVDARTVSGVVMCRLILMPIVAMIYVGILRNCNLLPDDPIVILVLLIAPSTPTALNLIVMSQTIGRHEKSVANLLFWVYLVSLAALTISITVFLYYVFPPA